MTSLTDKIKVYPDIENRGSYFVEGTKGEVEALIHLELYDPELTGIWKPKDAKLIRMAMCLDCESFWVDEDGTCGECSEQRLSKRSKPAYWFMKKDI